MWANQQALLWIKQWRARKAFQVDTWWTLTTWLVSYWKMEDATDYYWSNNWSNSWVTFSAGKVNNWGVFNWSSLITVRHNASLNVWNTISMAFWAKTSTTNNGYTIWKWDWTNWILLSVWWVSTWTNTFDARMWSSAWLNWISNVADWNRHLLWFTYDWTTLKTYKDWVLEQSVARSATINNSVNLYLSTRNWSAWPWTWSLDEIWYWWKVLSTTEWTDLYNSGNWQTMI